MSRPARSGFQVGARTLATIPRRLVRVALSLDEALAGQVPVLPPLARRARLSASPRCPTRSPGAAVLPRAGCSPCPPALHAALYRSRRSATTRGSAGLSANARSGLKRKAQEDRGRRPARRSVAIANADEHRGVPRAGPAGVGDDLSGAAARRRPARGSRRRACSPPPTRTGCARGCCCIGRRAGRLSLLHARRGRRCATIMSGMIRRLSELSPGTVLQPQAMRDLFEEARFAAVRFHRGRGAAQAAVRDRRGGLRRPAAAAADAREPRDAGGAGRVRRRGGAGEAATAAAGVEAAGEAGAALNPSSCPWRESEPVERYTGACICAPKPSSSPSARMASMARSCAR